MSKRQRTTTGGAFVVRGGGKRPIDKQLIVINDSMTAGTQESTTLTTATFPCTVTGIRWDISATSTISGLTQVWWAIVLVKDGNSANNFATSDGSSFYQPEQNVLAFGVAICGDADGNSGNLQQRMEGSTKTMRKLMAGDKLQVVYVATNFDASLTGIVQFFCKT